MTSIGLVLSGGGARAAYQVGVLRALADILAWQNSPFRVLTGVSAGAINSAAIAIGADDFRAATARLEQTWMGLTPESVYRTKASALTGIGARWLKDVTTGGMLGPSRVNYLLDTQPLRELLHRELDVSRIPLHIASGLLRGVAVSTTNYRTGTSVTFFDGVPTVEPWVRRSRISLRARIGVEHIMASAAIPIFFPPVKIDGQYHGDGGVRMTAPIGSAIHLGAEKVLSVGIRYTVPVSELCEANAEASTMDLTIADISGVLLNALFLDSLDNDVERLERINRTLDVIPEAYRDKLRDPLRRVPNLALRPSRDLGKLAADQYRRFPRMLRHLLRGIGATAGRGWDLVSYLAFEPEYVGKLIELGYKDTMARRTDVQTFFEAPVQDAAPPSIIPVWRPV